MDGLASGFGDLLSGLGRMYASVQLGTVGDWVGGVIAAIALLVAVITQRRQQDDSRRSEATLFHVQDHYSLTDQNPLTREFEARYRVFVLENNSDKKIRDVVVEARPYRHDFPAGKVAIITSEAFERGIDNILLDVRSQGIGQARFAVIKVGKKRRVRFQLDKGQEVYFFVRFTDSKGLRWVRDIENETLEIYKLPE